MGVFASKCFLRFRLYEITPISLTFAFCAESSLSLRAHIYCQAIGITLVISPLVTPRA